MLYTSLRKRRAESRHDTGKSPSLIHSIFNHNQHIHIMKKTLIALVALSGLASAGLQELTWSEDLTSTLPQQTNVDGLIFSAWTGTYSNNGGTPVPVELQSTTGRFGSEHLVSSQVFESTRANDMLTYSFSITNNMSEAVVLNAFSIDVYACTAGSDAQGSARNGSLTLTVGNTVADTVNFTVPGTDAMPGGAPLSVKVDFNDTLLAVGESKDITLAFKRTSGSRWYLGLDNATFTPEPATATLSLLALAGLAVRRRRH